ncbi:hypothetical protein AB0K68_52110, partial [Streptomyces sp. NPDC050698]
RIVIIDRRQLVGRCLAASLSEADRETSFEVFMAIWPRKLIERSTVNWWRAAHSDTKRKEAA